MNIDIDYAVMAVSAAAALLALVFAVDWRYFDEWVVVFLLKSLIDTFAGSFVAGLNYIEYPVRLFPRVFKEPVLFEFWIFPVLCVLYNQVTRSRGLPAIFNYAVLFSAGITGMEVLLERHTNLIRYLDWHWYTSLAALTATFLFSRAFMAFYRWGCAYFGCGAKGGRYRY